MRLKHGIVLLFCLVLTSKVNAANFVAQERKSAPIPENHLAKSFNEVQPKLINEKKLAYTSEKKTVIGSEKVKETIVPKIEVKNNKTLIPEKNKEIATIIKNNNESTSVAEKNIISENNEPIVFKIQDNTTKKESVTKKNHEAVNNNSQTAQISVLINKIAVEGYEILTDKEIQSVISKYEGKHLTLEEIKKIPEEINDIYRNYKVLTAIAYLPPQEITDNTVRIKVLEGKIGKIQVVGNKTTNTVYIKNVLKQKEGDTIFVPEIEQEIVNFNKNSDVKLTASIKKGEALGTTDIVLNLKENNPDHVSFNFNNTGTENTGLYKSGITTQIDSFIGLRDRFMNGYQFSDGTTSVYSSYDVPIGYNGLRLGALLSKGDSSIMQGEYKDYDIKAKTTTYSVYLSKPLYNSRKFYIGSNASLNFKKRKTYMLGVPLEDLGGEPTSRITTTKLSLTSILNDKYGQWAHNSDVHFGIGALGGKEEFIKYTGSIQRITLLGKNSMLILRGSTQLAGKQLPSLEKFQIGGFNTVHGYPESYSVADYGYVLNSELRYPLIFLPKKIGKYEFRNRFQGLVFMDMGRNYYKDKSVADLSTLVGVGSGVRFKISNCLSARIDYSYGLTHRNDSINPSRINFQVDSNPF